jgi:hypothetical protein
MGVFDGVLPAQAMRMRSWAKLGLVNDEQNKTQTMITNKDIRMDRYSSRRQVGCDAENARTITPA